MLNMQKVSLQTGFYDLKLGQFKLNCPQLAYFILYKQVYLSNDKNIKNLSNYLICRHQIPLFPFNNIKYKTKPTWSNKKVIYSSAIDSAYLPCLSAMKQKSISKITDAEKMEDDQKNTTETAQYFQNLLKNTKAKLQEKGAERHADDNSQINQGKTSETLNRIFLQKKNGSLEMGKEKTPDHKKYQNTSALFFKNFLQKSCKQNEEQQRQDKQQKFLSQNVSKGQNQGKNLKIKEEALEQNSPIKTKGELTLSLKGDNDSGKGNRSSSDQGSSNEQSCESCEQSQESEQQQWDYERSCIDSYIDQGSFKGHASKLCGLLKGVKNGSKKDSKYKELSLSSLSITGSFDGPCMQKLLIDFVLMTGLKSLKILSLIDTKLENIQFLSFMDTPLLQSINISKCNVCNLTSLSKNRFFALRELRMDMNPLKQHSLSRLYLMSEPLLIMIRSFDRVDGCLFSQNVSWLAKIMKSTQHYAMSIGNRPRSISLYAPVQAVQRKRFKDEIKVHSVL